MNIHQAVTAMADARANNQGILTLNGLRAALAMLPEGTLVVAEDGKSPATIGSYRGYYERLAIGTDRRRDDYETKVNRFSPSDYYEAGVADVTIAEPVTASELIKALDLANGEDFEGYKGGQFEMHGGTFIHFAERGDCGDAVVGLRIDGERAVIVTAEDEW